MTDKHLTNNTVDGLTYGRGYVYSLQYHIAWCTKYRHEVLTGAIADRCKSMMSDIAREYGFDITAMEVMPDHIHLLVDCRPQFCIATMMKIIKGTISRKLFIEYPELKRRLWGGHLWNTSYCAVSVSDRSERQVRHYIETQKKK